MRVVYVFLFASLLNACSGSGTVPQSETPASSMNAGHTLSSAQSGNTTTFKLVGKGAQGIFDSFSPDGCIDSYVNLFTIYKPGSEADILIGQFNNCTGTQLLYAVGTTLSASVQVDPQLASASVKATIPVVDSVSGNTINASVDMTWSATSPTTNAQFKYNLHTKTYIINEHSNGRYRSANASGTVSIGTTNFTPPGSEVLGQIFDNVSGTVAITHS